MENIKEVWVNAVLMPNGEVICNGMALGFANCEARPSGWIPMQFIKSAEDYQLVPRRASVEKV